MSRDDSVTPSSGNVFADLQLPSPRARQALADMMHEWNRALEEEIPDDLKRLLDRLN